MEKFFGTIITIIIVVWLLGKVMRLVLPWLLTRFVKKFQKRMEEQMGAGGFGNGFGYGNPFGGQNTTTDDDDVTIQYTAPRREGGSLSEEQGGEYIEYEEVKEEKIK